MSCKNIRSYLTGYYYTLRKTHLDYAFYQSNTLLNMYRSRKPRFNSHYLQLQMYRIILVFLSSIKRDIICVDQVYQNLGNCCWVLIRNQGWCGPFEQFLGSSKTRKDIKGTGIGISNRKMLLERIINSVRLVTLFKNA
jgi:hypothetical protein